MKRIGVLFGMEDTFPWALIERIQSMNVPDVTAEAVKLDGVKMGQALPYRLIIDRISHEIAFYRAAMKNAVLSGTVVINNPFWWSADDRFFEYALASRLGVATPKTVVLPQYEHPPGTTAKSMRNLNYPLDWEAIFSYVGFPAFLKPCSTGGWRNIHSVKSPEEFFRAYHSSGSMCMILQEAVDFTDYFRCQAINRSKVHIMRYDPRLPHESRYVKDGAPPDASILDRITEDSLKLCRALGYDWNSLEFAVRDGVPHVIDYFNPVPDADYHSVGAENFEWIVQAVAEMAVERVTAAEQPAAGLAWSDFLNARGAS